MSPRKRKYVVLGVAFCLLLAGGLVWALNRPAPEKPDFLRNMPEPNGYDLYVKAAEALVGEPWAVTNQFGEYVAQNREALRLWQEALGVRTEAPEQWYYLPQTPTDIGPPGEHPGMFKSVALAAKVYGQQAESENHPEKASRIYLDIIRMGQALEHGPTIMLLIGISFEQIGLRSLQDVAMKLDSEERMAVAGELEILNQSRIPLEEVMRRERHLMALNRRGVVEGLIQRFHPSLKTVFAKVRGKYEGMEGAMAAAAKEIREARE